MKANLEGELSPFKCGGASAGAAVLLNYKNLHPFTGQLRPCGKTAETGAYYYYIIFHPGTLLFLEANEYKHLTHLK
jgi:hypothetical protein